LLQLVTAADFLQMPELSAEIETALVKHLNLDNIFHLMESTEHLIPSLTILKNNVGMMIKENILWLDLQKISKAWLNASLSAPLTNVKDKIGRYLDVVESELKVCEVLSDVSDQEWNFSEDSKWLILAGLKIIRKHLANSGGKTVPEFTDNISSLLEDGTKLRFLLTKFGKEDTDNPPPQIAEHYKFLVPGVHTTGVYATATTWHCNVGDYCDSRCSPYCISQAKRRGKVWSVTGDIRKIFVKEGIWAGLHIVRWIKFLTSQGELIGPEGPEESSEATLALLNQNTTAFVIPEDQHIKEVILRTGWYVDQIGFVTNKGVQFGPVPAGGTGGYQSRMTKSLGMKQNTGSLKQYYLREITGVAFRDSQDIQGHLIAQLRFKFAVVTNNETIPKE